MHTADLYRWTRRSPLSRRRPASIFMLAAALLLLLLLAAAHLPQPVAGVKLEHRTTQQTGRWQSEAQLQPAVDTQLMETQGLGNMLGGIAKAAAGAAVQSVGKSLGLNPGGPLASGVLLPQATPAQPQPLAAEDIENCVACRYIWLQVELDVFNTQSEQLIYEAFTRRCTRAMLTSIFYSPCQHMQFYARKMVSEYMRGYTVNQICANSLLCL